MRRRPVTLTALLTVLVLAAATGSAHAQDASFSLNRFEPAARGSRWFTADSLAIRGDDAVAYGATLDWSHKPLVSYDEDGNEVTVIIRHRAFLHLGADYVLWERLRLGASLPVLAGQSTTSEVMDGVSYAPEEGAALGDPRLAADARIFEEPGGSAVLAAGVSAHLPLGSEAHYASDNHLRIDPRLQVAGKLGIFAYSGRVQANIRVRKKDVPGRKTGTEIELGAAGGVLLLDEKLIVGPELWGSTVVSRGSDVFLSEEATPFEVIVGAHYAFLEDWSAGLGVGPGGSRGLGTPNARVLASVDWAPSPEAGRQCSAPPPDADRDGISDSDDACVNEVGVPNQNSAKHGCPLPPDRDSDGVIDEEDTCPDVAAPPCSAPARRGCPAPVDADNDGIEDKLDACPREAGVDSPITEKRGCPVPKDSDGDGVPDPSDACPEKAGKPSNDPAKAGCPEVAVEKDTLVVLRNIEFVSGTAELNPSSAEILEAVAAVLRERPDLAKVVVEGHTDDLGPKPINATLSKERAKTVVRWLIKHGIAAGRLEARGFGSSRPIVPNDNDENRSRNRRVEFHIVSTSQPTQGASSATGGAAR